jgi:translation initiation factor 1A
MPKKKSKIRNTADRGREELVFKDDDQHYAHVIKSLGGGRFEIECDDGTSRVGKLRGNMRKSQWVSAGCVVLVSYRDFETETSNMSKGTPKADILLKYSDVATKQLRRYGELEWLKIKAARGGGGDDDDDDDDADDLVVFDDADVDLSAI